MSIPTKRMTEIPLSEILGSDIGRKAIVVNEGYAVEGQLSFIWIDLNYKGIPQARIKVGTGAAQLDVRNVPLDFLIQIDRTTEPETSKGEA